ncbi:MULTISPECIES: hypothetical protein [Bacillus cereus group]|uniref:hypothetical protein n=1 Tax=Bacillus cereus group TaxID=86661 RepID=UPI0005CF4559|nr:MULTISPECIES: hypothetical protein [Bacillus cereus group]PGM19149.1 hypothetical protein CN940_25860 [Bacillus cereus]
METEGVKQGYWAIATQKHLRLYAQESPGLGRLGNLNTAGKAGRFLGVIRGNDRITNMDKLQQMAESVGIVSRAELERIILPDIEKASDKRVELIKDVKGDIVGIQEYLLSNNSILETTGKLFENLNPNEIELSSIEAMDETKRIPYFQNELIQILAAKGFKEESIKLSLILQQEYKLLTMVNKSKHSDPIISNEYVWGYNHDKIALAVSSLGITEKETLKQIIAKIQGHQGIPMEWLPKEAEEIIKTAKRTGMINPTSIISNRGIQKEFGFSSKLLEVDNLMYNDDILDDVKLLLASIRFGENYTEYSTITDPVKFLSKLLNTGFIGPHSANATDYTLLEKKGIVRVVTKTVPGFYGARTGPCLEIVKEDIAQNTLNIISNPDFIMNDYGGINDFSSMMDAGGFITPEHNRAILGELSESSRELEEEALKKLRGENIQ